MKITVSINLGGYSFNIDEDAYSELKSYLKSLEIHFAGEESSAEILSDIESRMAELFRVRLGTRQVISMDDVRYVITVLGSPEDISDNETSSGHKRHRSGGYRRMYRNPDQRIIGGVCSGLAAYFAIDPVIMRILFIVLAFFGGLGVIIYLILYIVLPEARTTAQKIEMKGKPVNIQNIKDTVKREFDNVRRSMKL
jgi:phage shock protein PspC (stress-responsive transcriptional regulator)